MFSVGSFTPRKLITWMPSNNTYWRTPTRWRNSKCGSYKVMFMLDFPGGHFKNTYELLNLRSLKISMLYKDHIFQCMSMIFCVEFQRVPLKFHTKYLTHTLKDDFIHRWKFKSSSMFLKCPPGVLCPIQSAHSFVLLKCFVGAVLTHWGRNKMAAIFQTTFSNAFFEWKCMNFDWNFTEICSQGSNWQYYSIGSDNGLSLTRRQAIIWTSVGWFTEAYMRHSASVS